MSDFELSGPQPPTGEPTPLPAPSRHPDPDVKPPPQLTIGVFLPISTHLMSIVITGVAAQWILGLILYGWLAVKALRGRHWARLVMTVAVAFGILYIIYALLTVSAAPEFEADAVLKLLMLVSSVGLIWTRRASEFFRAHGWRSQRLSGPQPPVGEPLPVPPVHNEDVLPRRVGAALIDLVILAAWYFTFASTIIKIMEETGVFPAYPGHFNVVSDGVFSSPPDNFYTLSVVFALYGFSALLYYFACEAACGRTVGKLLVGLRVVRTGGARPSGQRVALRTVLRVIDWLPIGYILGFVVLLGNGKPHRRLGDLAADTIVVRAAPVRYRGLASALLTVALATGYATTAILWGDEVIVAYRAYGVSFRYPAGWKDLTADYAIGRQNDDDWTVAVGRNDVDLVTIDAHPVPAPVTADNLDEIEPVITSGLRLEFEAAGTVLNGPDRVTVAGLPGLRYRGERTRIVTPVTITTVVVFDGTRQFSVRCMHSQAATADIQRGCAQILGTFVVETAAGR